MTSRPSLVFWWLFLGWLPLLPAAVSIENEQLQVTYDDTKQVLSAKTTGATQDFLTGGQLAVQGKAEQGTESDHIRGEGQAIVVTDANGQTAHIVLFPKLPFVFVYLILKNSGDQDKILSKVPVLTFAPKLDKPLAHLKIRGTGGLNSAQSPDSGSYEWLAVADPDSRHGIVAGWVTQFKSTGVLIAHNKDQQLTVEIRGDYGHLRLASTGMVQTETVAMGYFDDARLGLEQWADEIAKTYHVKLPPQPAGYCTWYSDQHGGSSDEKNLAALAEFVGTNLKQYGLSFVQIDDGWQLGDSKGNGPRKNFTAFNPTGPYGSGIKASWIMSKKTV